MASELAPEKSPFPAVKPGDFDERQTGMQEDLADLEFRVDMEQSLKHNPIGRLGFDADAAEIYPFDQSNASYMRSDVAPERVRQYFDRKDQGNPVRQQFSKDIDPGDVIAYGDTAKPPIWAHEFTHRGMGQLQEYASKDPQEFVNKYGPEAYNLLLGIANDRNKDEHVTEMFDDFGSWMNMNVGGETKSVKMDKFQDMGTPTAIAKKKEFQQFLTERLEGTPGTKEERAYRANGVLGLVEAAEDLMLQRGSPPRTPAPKERNALGKMIHGTKYKPKYAKGGEVMEEALVDPVSGNEVPPGGSPEGVRDDIDAKLSEGEYVIPQNIVDFYGVEFFDSIINKAKEKLGDDTVMPHEPGGEQEIVMEEEMPMMNTGGVVTPQRFTKEQLTTSSMPAWTGEMWPNFSNPAATNAPAAPAYSRKVYINSAGEKRVINFKAGKPLQPIPEGFVENTAENRDKFNNQSQATVAKPVGPRDAPQSDGWLEERTKLGEEVNAKTGEIRGFNPEKFASMSADEIMESAIRGVKMGNVAEGLLEGGAGAVAGMLGNMVLPGLGAVTGKVGKGLAGNYMDKNPIGGARAYALSEVLRAQGHESEADKVMSEILSDMGMTKDEFLTSGTAQRGAKMYEDTYSQAVTAGSGTSRVSGSAGSDRVVSTGGGSGGYSDSGGYGEERAAANAQTAAERGTAPAGSGRGEVSFGDNVPSGGSGQVQSSTDMISGTNVPQNTTQEFDESVGSVNTGVTSQDDFQDGGFSMGTPMKKGGLVARPKGMKPKAKTKQKTLVKRKT